ncbi:MAG: GrpB family protein [Myxococcales bacterium]|nr:GrpB family protein [Myxococcales bacterium]
MSHRYKLTRTWHGIAKAVHEGFRVPFTTERERSLRIVGASTAAALVITNPLAAFAALGAAAYVAWTRRELISAMIRLNRLPHPALDLEPWSPSWLEEVARESDRIGGVLNAMQGIRSKVIHFGSTSVPKIPLAKPIHDIAIVLAEDRPTDDLRLALERLEYFVVGPAPHAPTGGDTWAIWLPETTVERENRGAGFSLHLVGPRGLARLESMLTHAAFLRAEPQEAAAYAAAKLAAASASHDGAENYRGYVEAKHAFLLGQKERAAEWAKRTGFEPKDEWRER